LMGVPSSSVALFAAFVLRHLSDKPVALDGRARPPSVFHAAPPEKSEAQTAYQSQFHLLAQTLLSRPACPGPLLPSRRQSERAYKMPSSTA
jgi:hypothetical protein